MIARNKLPNSDGFTLLEILIVVVIIGITVSFALFAFGDFGSSRRIIMAAEQLTNYLKFLQQQAILETSTLGIRINSKGYQVLRFQPPASWQNLPQKSIFRYHAFPQDTVIRFEHQQKKSNAPEIILHPSGEMDPFKMSVGSTQNPHLIRITGTENGHISNQPMHTP